MGSTVSSYISRVDAFKSASGEEQCVVYSTPDSRTCTLRASMGVDSASVSLRDYTFDREGTGVEIKVCGGTTNIGIGTDVKYWGNALQVVQYPRFFCISYGVQGVRCGILALEVINNDPHTYRQSLAVLHMNATPERGLAVLVAPVWYDVGKCRFMCNLTGPSWCSSKLEAQSAIWKAIHFLVADSTGQQTAITGLINNTGGPIYGDLNGSILGFITNVFNLNCK